jgi:hypothetical protein
MVHEDVVLNNTDEVILWLLLAQMNVVMVNVMVEKYVAMVIVVDQPFVNGYLIVNKVRSMVRYKVVVLELLKAYHHVKPMIVLNNDDDDVNVVQD